MQKQSLIQFRIDQNFKQEAEEICEQLGTDLPTVLRMCLKQMVLQRGIPFPVHLPQEETPQAEASVTEGEDLAREEESFGIDLGGINREVEAMRKEYKK